MLLRLLRKSQRGILFEHHMLWQWVQQYF